MTREIMLAELTPEHISTPRWMPLDRHRRAPCPRCTAGADLHDRRRRQCYLLEPRLRRTGWPRTAARPGPMVRHWKIYTTTVTTSRTPSVRWLRRFASSAPSATPCAIAERPDGSRIAFRPYPTPLFDADGNLIGAVNMLIDVSERTEPRRCASRPTDGRRLARRRLYGRESLIVDWRKWPKGSTAPRRNSSRVPDRAIQSKLELNRDLVAGDNAASLRQHLHLDRQEVAAATLRGEDRRPPGDAYRSSLRP